MVLLLYLWDHLKDWTSREDMRSPFKTSPHSGSRRVECVGGRYYPEGGWGWIVCACAFLAHVTTSGAQLSAGALHVVLPTRFKKSQDGAQWVGPVSWCVSSLSAPLVVRLCRKGRGRLVALSGGFLFPLSLLLSSFATETTHLFLSFSLLGGLGSSLVRESSGVVLGQFFRRRRQFVEQVVLAGTGVGVTLFSLLYLSLGRHVPWEEGFQGAAAVSLITAILPLFYKAPNTTNSAQNSVKVTGKFWFPIGGEILSSLRLFWVPQIKPLLIATILSSTGLFTPLFLMSEVGKKEGLSGGSLLLIQTHLGLGISLGVILGCLLSLKKVKCFWNPSIRTLSAVSGIITGLSILTLSRVEGYYAYSLSAWVYGISLGGHLYTTKVLSMEWTRSKHWEKLWALLESLWIPGLVSGTALASALGKEAFYVCAAAILTASGILLFPAVESSCGSEEVSSEDNESPIPPPPPPPPTQPIPNYKYEIRTPLRRSISLSYSPYCRDCNPIIPPTNILRSVSLPPPPSTQPIITNTHRPNTPTPHPVTTQSHGTPSTTHTMPPNPNLTMPTMWNNNGEKRSGSRERFPDFPIEPQFFPILQIPLQQQQPAFTRHHVDSSLLYNNQPEERPQFNSLRRPHHQNPVVQGRRGSFGGETAHAQRDDPHFFYFQNNSFQ